MSGINNIFFFLSYDAPKTFVFHIHFKCEAVVHLSIALSVRMSNNCGFSIIRYKILAFRT